jgi:hypothetical protein
MALLHPGEAALGHEAHTAPLGRARALLTAAVVPLVTGYAAIAAVLAAVVAMAPHSQFDTVGALTGAAPGWLAAHQVPLAIGHKELGALPLLPTILLMLLVARTAAATAERLDDHLPRHAGRLIATIAAAHASFGLVLALLTESQPITAAAMPGMTYPALLSAFAATVGVARRCGLLDALLDRVDGPAIAGLRMGLLALAALLAAGAVLLVVALLGSVTEVRATYTSLAPGVGAGAGMLLLCAGYLPNAVVAGTAFVAGPGFSLGTQVVGPAQYTVSPLPEFPLLDAIPDHQASWWPALCLIPLAIGVLIGWLLRNVDEEPLTRLRAVAVAAVIAALGCVLLSGMAGGRIGTGPLDPFSTRALLLSVSVLGWIAVPGGLVAWLRGPRPEVVDPPGLIPFDDEDSDLADDPVEDADEEPEPEDPDEPDDLAEDTESADEEPPARER